MNVVIVGGGVVGLTLALGLKQRGIECRVYETAPEVKPLGVGITLLPHAMRELTALGLQDRLRAVSVEHREHVFYTRHGQFIYKEPRGLAAGYPYPELGIHRGKLHMLLWNAAIEQLGADRIFTNHRCFRVDQDGRRARAYFKQTTTGIDLPPAEGDIVIACDGVNSAIRKQFYPEEQLAFGGINMWRGITRRKPILDGHTYVRFGTVDTGKILIYPIVDNVDGQGNQLINWVTELRRSNVGMNDWNQPGRLPDFFDYYKDLRFDWLDVAQLIQDSELLLEYPMVDRDPVARWTFERITLMGDAAHPMYPRGANGAAQGLIDARTLADLLAHTPDPLEALAKYEEARLQTTAKIVRTNRAQPPDYINMMVDELTGGKPFKNIDDVISQEELRRISQHYAQIAGFSLEAVK